MTTCDLCMEPTRAVFLLGMNYLCELCLQIKEVEAMNEEKTMQYVQSLEETR